MYLSINVCSFTLNALSKCSLNRSPLLVSNEEELFVDWFCFFLEIIKLQRKTPCTVPIYRKKKKMKESGYDVILTPGITLLL